MKLFINKTFVNMFAQTVIKKNEKKIFFHILIA